MAPKLQPVLKMRLHGTEWDSPSVNCSKSKVSSLQGEEGTADEVNAWKAAGVYTHTCCKTAAEGCVVGPVLVSVLAGEAKETWSR